MIPEIPRYQDPIAVQRPDRLMYPHVHTVNRLLPQQTLLKVAIPWNPDTFKIEMTWPQGKGTRTIPVTSVQRLKSCDNALIVLPRTDNITPVTIASVDRRGLREIHTRHMIVNSKNPQWETVREDVLLPFFTELTKDQDLFPTLFQSMTTKQGNLIMLSEPDKKGFFIIGGKSKRPEMVSVGVVNTAGVSSFASTLSDAYSGVWGVKMSGGEALSEIAVSFPSEWKATTFKPTALIL